MHESSDICLLEQRLQEVSSSLSVSKNKISKLREPNDKGLQ